MKPELQRIKIAEACGWEQCLNARGQRYLVFGLSNIKGTTPIGIEPLAEGSLDFIPDYLNDLNAMHDAEQILWRMDWNNRYAFNDNLASILRGRVVNRNEWDAETLLDATAAQRAEAFLRALNLWETQLS